MVRFLTQITRVETLTPTRISLLKRFCDNERKAMCPKPIKQPILLSSSKNLPAEAQTSRSDDAMITELEDVQEESNLFIDMEQMQDEEYQA